MGDLLPLSFSGKPEAEIHSLNIEALPVWKPMHLQAAYRQYETAGSAVVEELFTYGLCLPSGSAMCEPEQQRVVEIVRGVSMAA